MIKNLIAFLFLIIISCSGEQKNQRQNNTNLHSQTEHDKEVKENNYLENLQIKSFAISCGGGCAMTYTVKDINKESFSFKVRFEVETYINEQLSETSSETYLFFYDPSDKISKILLEGTKNNALETLPQDARKSFIEFSQDLIKNPSSGSVNHSQKISDNAFIILKNTYRPEEILTLYNSDHSKWKSFQLNDEFSDDEFLPYAIKPEYTRLVFKYLGKENGFYKVLVDQENNLIKYISESDPYFYYQPVEKHILTVFSVGFNEKKNPLRTAPNETSKTQPADEDSFYYPVKIKGQWLMVKDDYQKNFWVKWCDDKGRLILELYYDA